MGSQGTLDNQREPKRQEEERGSKEAGALTVRPLFARSQGSSQDPCGRWMDKAPGVWKKTGSVFNPLPRIGPGYPVPGTIVFLDLFPF